MSKRAQHGVCSAAHAALQVEEGGRNESCTHVGKQEVRHVLSYLVGDGVGILEGTRLVGHVALYDAHDALCVYFHIGLAYAVARLEDGHGRAEWMILQLIDVVQSLALGAVEGVELYDDALGGETADGGADAAGSGEVDVCLGAHLFDGACLDDRPVHLAQITLAYLRRHVGEVEVAVVEIGVAVDVLAEVGIGGVGRAEVDGVSVGEHAVAALSGACTCEDAHLEGFARSMFCLCLLGKFGGSAFGGTCRREATQSDGLSVLDKGSCLSSRDFIEVHLLNF